MPPPHVSTMLPHYLVIYRWSQYLFQTVASFLTLIFHKVV